MLVRIRMGFPNIVFDKFLFFDAETGLPHNSCTKLDLCLYVDSARQVPELLQSFAKNSSKWWEEKYNTREQRAFEFHGHLPLGDINQAHFFPEITDFCLQEIGANVANSFKEKPFINSLGKHKSNLSYGNIEIKYKNLSRDHSSNAFAINVHIVKNRNAKGRKNIHADFMSLVRRDFSRLAFHEMNNCLAAMTEINLMTVCRALRRGSQSPIFVYPKSIEEGAIDNLQDIGRIIELQNAQRRSVAKEQSPANHTSRFFAKLEIVTSYRFALLPVEGSPLSPVSPSG